MLGFDNIRGFKGREVKKGEYSKCYFNLHKHLFSMKQSGLVVLHSEGIKLTEVKFTVNEKDRQRVLAEGRKNVHAFVNGNYRGIAERVPEGYKQAYYNPHKLSTFIDKESGKELTEASEVVLLNKQIWYK